MKPLIVEFLGCPGTGKTTSACYIFSMFKLKGVRASLALESASYFIQQRQSHIVKEERNQLSVLTHQYRTYKNLQELGHNLIISDSSISLNKIYRKNQKSKLIDDLILDLESEFKFIRVLLLPMHRYDTLGRLQTEEELKALQYNIEKLHNYNYTISSSQKELEELFYKLVALKQMRERIEIK